MINLSNRNTRQDSTFAHESLEAVRKKLFDLTSKNRLLNFKHPRTSSIRLIDDLPDQIVEMLMNGDAMTLLPIPDPSEEELIAAGYINSGSKSDEKVKVVLPTPEEWAKYKGINVQLDLLNQTTNHKESRCNDLS